MLIHPESLEEFARHSAAPASLWSAIRDIAAATRTALGEQRLDFLRSLPRVQALPPLGLVHASPESCWHAPSSTTTDAELEAVFGSVDQPIVAFGHTHHPFVRIIEKSGLVVANTGSVGLPYDGDPRASYLLIDDSQASIRRVEYDREKELKLLSSCGLPGAGWTAKMLVSASPQMP
jgi:diadenosine tetraphosphatase ApaH/serine/threonine PP2A family protein phosphatase